MHDGDLLITNAGPRSRCGVICHVKKTRSKLMISGKMYRLRFPKSHVHTEYIESWLRTSFAQKELNDRKTGINESGLNMTQARFLTLPVVLAPVEEQKVIARKLDTLLAQAESTKARLERTRETMKRFRQSVLAAAVSGKLTAEWCGNKSADWQLVKLLDVVRAKPRNGKSPKGVDYITSYKNLTLSATTSGIFLGDKFKYVELDIDEKSHLWIKNGDILIQRANTIDYVGVSAIYRGEDDAYVYPDLMMKCTPNEKVLGEFLHYSLLSGNVRKYFKDNATGTSGNMPKINQTVVSCTPLLLPSLEEQTEIVRRVEQLFAHADTIEKQTEAALTKVSNLTQSILAKAFRGELTEQWRKDNPELISGENSAEALLEKIKAERAIMAGKKTKPRKRTGTRTGSAA
ncbi:restriction endonuclease subunit S [Endozoicomonas numazuensis]|uniref:restriction endonuclease subunit S n=1 Tax=Endozoicomonas numazuensis TaxID=1137799 RepID=UPI001376DF80|nr:restriction endonuclease subunit S [Endozoicomonas numazuensis]